VPIEKINGEIRRGLGSENSHIISLNSFGSPEKWWKVSVGMAHARTIFHEGVPRLLRN
jgi:hypothetical protein